MSNPKEQMKALKNQLAEISQRDVNIMEVCGTHTMSLARHAIRTFLPDNIHIISGPGCPVCVTDSADLSMVFKLADREDTIIATFGDMLKIPIKRKTLQNYSNVKVVYSPLESLQLARENPEKEVIFLGVGFETTAPLVATTIKEAHRLQLPNFSVLPMHKLVPPALDVILKNENSKIDGLILPGHVSVVTGSEFYQFLDHYRVPGVICGFEAIPIMESLVRLVNVLNHDDYEVINHYPELVSSEGNRKAQEMVNEVYEEADALWRSIGTIPKSGLAIRPPYQRFDAIKKFDLTQGESFEAKGCLCGNILMGQANPLDCVHFASSCTPSNPIGPCMVSAEGTCAAYFKYSLQDQLKERSS